MPMLPYPPATKPDAAEHSLLRVLGGVLAFLSLLLTLLGDRRVALGSDYPFALGEAEPGKLIASLPELSQETRQRLVAGNAREFLGLSGTAGP